MKRLEETLFVTFALLFLPERREAFAPLKRNQLCYPLPPSYSLFSSYQDEVAPNDSEYDGQEYNDYDPQWQQQQQPSSDVQNGHWNWSYRGDMAPPNSSPPQQGFHEQVPYDSRRVNNGPNPGGSRYSDPWNGSAPVNSMNNNRNAYRERTGAVSTAHNSKGPPAGSFAPSPRSTMPSSGGYGRPSAHNGRDVTPWNAQTHIRHSYSENVAVPPPTSGDGSLSRRWGYQYEDPNYQQYYQYQDENAYNQYQDENYYDPYQDSSYQTQEPDYDDYQYSQGYSDYSDYPQQQQQYDNSYGYQQGQYQVNNPGDPALPATSSYNEPVNRESTSGQRTYRPPSFQGVNSDLNKIGYQIVRPQERMLPPSSPWDDSATFNPPTRNDARPTSSDVRLPNAVTNPTRIPSPPKNNGVSTVQSSNTASVPSNVGSNASPVVPSVRNAAVPTVGASAPLSHGNAGAPPPADSSSGNVAETSAATWSTIPSNQRKASSSVNSDATMRPPETTATSPPIVNQPTISTPPTGETPLATGSFSFTLKGPSATASNAGIIDSDARATPPETMAAVPPVANGASPKSEIAVPITESFSVTLNTAPQSSATQGATTPSATNNAAPTPPQGTPTSADISNNVQAKQNVPSQDNKVSVGEIPNQVEASETSTYANGKTDPSSSPVPEHPAKSKMDPSKMADVSSKQNLLPSESDRAFAKAMDAIQTGLAELRKEEERISSLKTEPSPTSEPLEVAKKSVVDAKPAKPEAPISKGTFRTLTPLEKRWIGGKEKERAPAKESDTSKPPLEDIDPKMRIFGKDYMARLKKAAKDNPTRLEDELEKRKVLEVDYKTGKVTEREVSNVKSETRNRKTGGDAVAPATSTRKSKSKKNDSVHHKSPIEAGASAMNSILNQLSKPSKKRSSGEQGKQAKGPFKPEPPKTPPPELERAASPSAARNSSKRVETSKAPKKSFPSYAFSAAVSDEDENEELTLEERIAASIADAREVSTSTASFETTRESLEEFISTTQLRLDLSASRKVAAAEKVADITSRMEAETRAVEDKLAEDLAETQAMIDEEVDSIKDLLTNEMELEEEREENMVKLMDTLQEFIDAKEYDIAKEKNITKEVMAVRSKLKDGTIADNLDNLVEQKLSAVLVEQELVNDLFDFLIDLEEISEDSRDRISRIRQTLDNFHRPHTDSSTPYDWEMIEEMFLVLEEAAESVKRAEGRIAEISQRIDNAFVSRAVVLGEDVPAGVAKAAQRAAGRSVKRASDYPDVDLDLDVEDFAELKNKDEKELLGLLAKSVSSATYDGSKAAAFGIKAIADAVTGKPAAEAKKQIASLKKNQGEGTQDVNTILEYSDGSKNNKVVETVKSTASVLGSVGKAGTTIVKGIGETDSAQVASEALKDTGKGLFSTLETAAALGAKLYNTTMSRIDEKRKKGEDDKR